MYSIPLICLCVTSTHSKTGVEGSSRNMSSFTRTDRSNTAFAVFVLTVCAIFESQVDANLLDPSLIMRELRTFANDALGVDEIRVRKHSFFSVVRIACQIFCDVQLKVPLKILSTLPCKRI